MCIALKKVTVGLFVDQNSFRVSLLRFYTYILIRINHHDSTSFRKTFVRTTTHLGRLCIVLRNLGLNEEVLFLKTKAAA